jgi:hypothetical protein
MVNGGERKRRRISLTVNLLAWRQRNIRQTRWRAYLASLSAAPLPTYSTVSA